MKKPYITKIDRTWKGKTWFSSLGRAKIIRKLTDEEAKPLLEEGTIEEVIPLKDCEENVVGEDRENGRMFCLKCKSQRGFYIHKHHRGAMMNWYHIFRCSDCGCREKKPVYNHLQN